MLPLVSIITASIGGPLLQRCMDSVKNQTYRNIQHLTFADGVHAEFGVQAAQNRVSGNKWKDYRNDVINLPYSVGKDRWNGHRQYGAGTYLADGDFVMYLDDDNYIDPDHVEKCMDTIKKGNDWTYSLRKIVNAESEFLVNDDCESLGKWPSIIHRDDYFVDVNCFFLPKLLAVQISPIWYCKFREPGQPEIDRKLTYALRQIAPKFDCTYHYTVNYNVGNTPLSVQKEFFEQGNLTMFIRHGGKLPWKIIRNNT